MTGDLPAGARELCIGTTPMELGRLYPWLDGAGADLPETVLAGMHVALEEAVMNVAMHGGGTPEITVRLTVQADAAVLVVEDGGAPFDQGTAPVPARPASLEAAGPGGLGLRLLRHYCRDIAYERAREKNRLTLRFALR